MHDLLHDGGFGTFCGGPRAFQKTPMGWDPEVGPSLGVCGSLVSTPAALPKPYHEVFRYNGIYLFA